MKHTTDQIPVRLCALFVDRNIAFFTNNKKTSGLNRIDTKQILRMFLYDAYSGPVLEVI